MVHERTVLLDRKNADRSVARVQGEQEFAVATDRDIEVRCSGRIDANDRRGQRRQASALSDREP